MGVNMLGMKGDRERRHWPVPMQERALLFKDNGLSAPTRVLTGPSPETGLVAETSSLSHLSSFPFRNLFLLSLSVFLGQKRLADVQGCGC